MTYRRRKSNYSQQVLRVNGVDVAEHATRLRLVGTGTKRRGRRLGGSRQCRKLAWNTAPGERGVEGRRIFNAGERGVEVEEPEEDVVPETQEEPSRKRKGKAKVKNAQTKAVPWNETEHLALADAWCTTSKHPIKESDTNKNGYPKKLRRTIPKDHEEIIMRRMPPGRLQDRWEGIKQSDRLDIGRSLRRRTSIGRKCNEQCSNTSKQRKRKKQLREQHLEFLRQKEQRAIARQEQEQERALARVAQEDAQVAQEKHIRQQQEIINAMNILEMKTTGLEDPEDIELIREMKRKARADLRRLR
ncbi:hypothetical protein LXL04_005508 [Taraxacum kok-saghyz]